MKGVNLLPSKVEFKLTAYKKCTQPGWNPEYEGKSYEGVDHLRYIVDSLISLTRWLLTKIQVAGVFFHMAPSQDGERAERLTYTLFGAKDGGRHHQERASALTSLRRQIRCFALATIISWVYELIDRQLAKHPRPVMFGSKRVSVFATDRWSYGNQPADRKSTI